MQIPKNARLVFNGKLFQVYQWRQKMFDGSYQIFERARRADSVITIATVKDKIVVLKQKQPGTKWFYCTPSGRMDIPGEKPKAAALRELLEETGMRPKKFFLWKKVQKTGKLVSNIYFYIARDCEKVTSQKLDPGEKIKVQLFSFDRFLKISDDPMSADWMSQSVIDMLKARIDAKHKRYLKKVIFG